MAAARGGERDGLRSGGRPAGHARAVVAGPDDAQPYAGRAARSSGSGPAQEPDVRTLGEGVNLAWSPDGSLLACTTGTSTVWVLDAATGEPVRQFDDHSETVTGLGWVYDEWVAVGLDATFSVGPDASASSTVVETIAAAGTAVRARARHRPDLVGGGELFAWSLRDTPAQLGYRDRRRAAWRRTSPGWRSAPWTACWRWSTRARPSSP